MKKQRPEMLTVKEVARFLALSEKTVYRLLENGSLPAFKIGEQWRFEQTMLDAWVTDRAREAMDEMGNKKWVKKKGKG